MALAAYGVRVYLAADSAGSPGAYTEIDGIDNASVSDTMDALDVSDFKDQVGARKRLLAMRDATISLSGHIELADAAQNNLRTYHTARTLAWVKVLFNGTNGVSVQCWIASTNHNASVSGKAAFSCEAVGNGSFNDAAT